MSKIDDFTKDPLVFYISEEPIEEYDKRTFELYNAVLEEMRLWLQGVLDRDIAENAYCRASVTLYMPLGDLTVSSEGTGVVHPEVFLTPIGRMDKFTYEAITGEADNPVKKFLDWLYAAINLIDITIEGAAREEGFSLITGELLDLCHWIDPLGLRLMTPVVHSFEEFMSGMYGDGTSV